MQVLTVQGPDRPMVDTAHPIFVVLCGFAPRSFASSIVARNVSLDFIVRKDRGKINRRWRGDVERPRPGRKSEHSESREDTAGAALVTQRRVEVFQVQVGEQGGTQSAGRGAWQDNTFETVHEIA